MISASITFSDRCVCNPICTFSSVQMFSYCVQPIGFECYFYNFYNRGIFFKRYLCPYTVHVFKILFSFQKGSVKHFLFGFFLQKFVNKNSDPLLLTLALFEEQRWGVVHAKKKKKKKFKKKPFEIH